MRTLVSASVALLAAATLGAQRPTQPLPAAPQFNAQTGPVLLDGIVAVVGDQPITRLDLRERVLAKIQRQEVPEPTGDSAVRALDSLTLNDLIEEELLLQKAKDLKIEVTDADVSPTVDRQIGAVRARYPNEAQYRADLVKAGLGSPEEYRRFLIDEFRRQNTLDKTIGKLTQDSKIVPLNPTDAEVAAEFERTKPFLGPKPATITFKQLIIATAPTNAARLAAHVRAESLLVQIKGGADFDRIAKRESMDPLTKETGGDLGWVRHGTYPPEVERWLFGGSFQQPLQPGQMSPVFETTIGSYIVRVDRAQTGEVKARQILILPAIDSSDIARTHKLADSVAALLKGGAPFDTLTKKYHDYAGQEDAGTIAFARDSLPVSYQQAFANTKPGDIIDFQIPGSAQRPDVPKFVVAQITAIDAGGERTLAEMKSAVRTELAQRGGIHRYVDGLRKQTYVAWMLNEPATAEVKTKP
jgi:peptidyl-prolyl cis-trans isomerase SurA